MSSRSILREMPLFIMVEQRVVYESIALTTDIMEINLANIHALALSRTEADPDNPNFTDQERSLMMSLAWGIVDQADLLRRLIKREGHRIDLKSARDFLESAEIARKMRNFMDHFPQRVPEFIKIKGNLPPAHGALSFTYVDPVDAEKAIPGNPVSKYRTVVILSCAAQRGLEVSGEPYPYGNLKVPIDHFALQSFGHDLPLMEIVQLAGKFCDEFAVGVRRFCAEQAEKIALSEGRPLEEVMQVSSMLAGTLVRTAVLGAELRTVN